MRLISPFVDKIILPNQEESCLRHAVYSFLTGSREHRVPGGRSIARGISPTTTAHPPRHITRILLFSTMKKTLITLLALAGVACGADGELTQIYDFQGIRSTGKGQGNLIENTTDYDRTVFDMKDAPVYANIENATITNILNGSDTNTCLTLAFWVNYNSTDANQQMLFGWGETNGEVGTGVKFGIDNGINFIF